MDEGKIGGEARGSQPGAKVAVALALVLFSWYYIQVARRTDVSFDGAIFLQPIVSLERFGVLTHTYDVDSPAEFHPPLTNLGQGMFSQFILSWPFIHFFGIHHFPLQASNLLFLALGAVLIGVLIRRLTGSWWLSLVGVLLFYMMPQMKVLSLGGLGEVPGAFYLLLAALLLHRSLSGARSYGWLGFVLFLAFHTKNHLIVTYPVMLAVLVYLAWRQRSVRLRDLVWLSVGFWAPLVLLLTFFIFRYGWGSFVSEMSDYWQLFASTQWGTGAGRQPHTSDLTVEAVRELARNYGGWFLVYVPILVTYLLALLALLLPPVCASQRRQECRGIQRRLPVLDVEQAVILFLLALCLFYVAYWFHFSTFTHWYRRVLPFLILQIPLLVISLHLLWTRSSAPRKARRVARVAGIAALVLLAVAHVRYFVLVFSLPSPGELDLRDRMSATEVVRRLPADAVIFGIGWWQAPRIALFSGRRFLDFLKKGDSYPEGYLVLDPEARAIAAETIKNVLASVDASVVLENPSYQVLKWTRRKIDLARFPEDEQLRLIRIGPDQAFTDGAGFYSLPDGAVAMWAMAKNATSETVLVWEGQVLNSTVQPDRTVVTAVVPRYLFSKPGSFSIVLFDPVGKRRSQAAAIRISRR
ncbi:MAG: hypothetical protein EHM23_06700 [Acidobacteria bacterium]|nr:MAG: hypothetical protein EHM23_06700 [Acidobacteriota bacterium]